MIDFKPSAVNLGGSYPPLCDTFGRSEAEAAATLIVLACVELGDAWIPVGPETIGRLIEGARTSRTEPLYSLSRNPFWHPDIWELIKRGAAEWVGEPGDHGVVQFTEAGLERLRRWVNS